MGFAHQFKRLGRLDALSLAGVFLLGGSNASQAQVKQQPQLPPAAVDGQLARETSLQPHAPVGIPSDPPPHEGAMIDLPIILEPPDIIVVEVLEALPVARSRVNG